MSARNLTELPTDLVSNFIQANISASLAAMRAERTVDGNNTLVNVEPPPSESYFIYSKAKAYRAPAIFTVPQGFKFKLTRGQNHVNGTLAMIVSAVVEDRDATKLSRKAWRYLDVLHELMQGTVLEDTNDRVRCTVNVTDARYSSDLAMKDNMGDIFRKEVALDLDIEVYQEL